MIVTPGRAGRRLLLLVASAVLVAGAVVAVPPSADAATGTITVTTLDRNGKSVRSQFGVKNVRTGDERYFWTGAAHRLPTGSYDVFTAIATVAIGADTLGVKRVTVSGAARVTIDARQGRPVRGYLQPALPARYSGQTSVWLCYGNGPMVGGGSFEGPAYVIPSSLAEVRMAFSSIWQWHAPDNRSATYYAGAAATSRGVPAGMTRTFRQSDLTDLVVHGRSGEQSGDAQVEVRNGAADECRAVTLQLFPQATLPYGLDMHVPAGSWSVGQSAQDYVYGPVRSYAARHVYSMTTGVAAWGPSRGLPRVDSYCRCLITSTATMFADPRLPSGASANVAYTLYKAGRVIARRTVDPDLASFTPKLPAKGWYLLAAVATRSPNQPLPANALSPRSSVRAHFYADPGHAGQVGGYITRFRPYGLGVDNRARTKTTTVGLGLSRSSDAGGSRIPVRSVSARMSADGGRTWHSIPVHHVNGQWSATVTNPKAGFVYLLANVVDTHGNSTETVVARAYAVG